MVRQLLLLLRRRLFWLTLLLAIWLFCSGQARGEDLANRLQTFPDWQQPPALAAAQGDLIYPDWMEGTWTLTTPLKEMVAPLAPGIVTPGTEQPSQGEFVTSEILQQIFRGTAQPYLNRVETTTAYQHQRDAIQADQVTAIYLSPQDGDFLKSLDRPVALYRYHLE